MNWKKSCRSCGDKSMVFLVLHPNLQFEFWFQPSCVGYLLMFPFHHIDVLKICIVYIKKNLLIVWDLNDQNHRQCTGFLILFLMCSVHIEHMDFSSILILPLKEWLVYFLDLHQLCFLWFHLPIYQLFCFLWCLNVPRSIVLLFHGLLMLHSTIISIFLNNLCQ